MRIRTMTGSDLARADAIGTEVGWPGRRVRFDFFVHHPYCYALCAELEGEMVGMGFGTRNGPVGWLGLICVSPRYQGRGVGLALTEHVAARLEETGCRTLVLTATEAGRSIYEKLGFTTETTYHGFSGQGFRSDALKPGMRRMMPEDLPAVCDLDLRLTGEDRSHLLRVLEGPGWLVTDDDGSVRGYHLPVPWGGGPIVVEDLAAARALLRLMRAQAGPDGTVTSWLTTENEEGREYMNSIGFEEKRRLPRMIRGGTLAWIPESLWGLFSLGKG